MKSKMKYLLFIITIFLINGCSTTHNSELPIQKTFPPEFASSLSKITEYFTYKNATTNFHDIDKGKIFTVAYDPYSGVSRWHVYSYYYDNKLSCWKQFSQMTLSVNEDFFSHTKIDVLKDNLLYLDEENKPLVMFPLMKFRNLK